MRPVTSAKTILSLIISAYFSLYASPQRAEARGIVLPLDIQLAQTLIVLVSASSHCVKLTYDENGNRQSQAVATVGSAGANWGSGSFGCFVWHS